MQLGCLTARGGALRSWHCAKCYFSLPSHWPSSFSQHSYTSCMLLFLTNPRPDVSQLLPTLYSPPLSPLSPQLLVFSWVARWRWELCTIGHKGMKIFSQAVEFTRLKMHRKHLPLKLWHPRDQPANVSSKYQISSLEEEQACRPWTIGLLREVLLLFFLFHKKTN